jgi:hypothetical protein
MGTSPYPIFAKNPMTAPSSPEPLAGLPHLRLYVSVLAGEAVKTDQLLVNTVELARALSILLHFAPASARRA